MFRAVIRSLSLLLFAVSLHAQSATGIYSGTFSVYIILPPGCTNITSFSYSGSVTAVVTQSGSGLAAEFIMTNPTFVKNEGGICTGYRPGGMGRRGASRQRKARERQRLRQLHHVRRRSFDHRNVQQFDDDDPRREQRPRGELRHDPHVDDGEAAGLLWLLPHASVGDRECDAPLDDRRRDERLDRLGRHAGAVRRSAGRRAVDAHADPHRDRTVRHHHRTRDRCTARSPSPATASPPASRFLFTA